MKKYILIIVAICVLLFIFYRINKHANSVMSQIDISEKNIDREDSLLFRKSMYGKITVETVVKSKTRNPIKYYKYNNQYNLYITKIDIKNDTTMDNFILFNEEITSPNSFVPYLNLQSNKLYDVKFRDEKSEIVSKIIFSMAGDGKKLKRIVYNKNFISYSLPLYSFSLQYENIKNPVDIFVGAKSSRIFDKKGVPFIVSFYKKEKSIYLILMTPINEETKMSENILDEFIEYSNVPN